jgi:hypothetical protein
MRKSIKIFSNPGLTPSFFSHYNKSCPFRTFGILLKMIIFGKEFRLGRYYSSCTHFKYIRTCV